MNVLQPLPLLMLGVVVGVIATIYLLSFLSIAEQAFLNALYVNKRRRSSTPHSCPTDSTSVSEDNSSEDSILEAVAMLFVEDPAEDDSVSLSSEDSLEDSILAAVSTLFQENISCPEAAVFHDSFVARILPSGKQEYEREKPWSRRCDATALREKINQRTFLETGHGNWNLDDESKEEKGRFCELQVQSTFLSPSDSNFRHQLKLCLHRDASESADRSLRRLGLSLQRRLAKQEHAFVEKQKRQQKQCRQHTNKEGFPKMTLDQHNLEAHVRRECSSTGSGDESSLFDLTSIKSAKLWQHLAETNENKYQLCLRLPNYHQASHLPTPDFCLPITACPPTILSVETFDDFTAKVFVGVPLVVTVHVLHATHAHITWFADQRVVCNDSNVYFPQSKDVGKHISVLIVPLRPGQDGEGWEEAYEYENVVEALPDMPMISPTRKEWIKHADRSNLRVMSYNLLADLYVTREADNPIMYNHCPAEFLSRKRRMPMLLNEILVFQPDIICLQEVDSFIFDRFLKPSLKSQGYQGFYSNKASAQLEGCALFWNLACFQRVGEAQMQTYNLRDLFCNHRSRYSRWDSHDNIEQLLDGKADLGYVVRCKIGQVLQIVELRPRNRSSNRRIPERLVIGNTHLFYHPLADHIRVMQAFMVCQQLDSVRRQGGKICPIILCGDFNSSPLSGTIKLILQGQVGPSDHETWKNINEYSWEMGDQEFLLEHGYIGNEAGCGEPLYVEKSFQDSFQFIEELADTVEVPNGSPLEIKLPPSFPHLVSGYPELPDFTNFAVDFTETLDYIFVSTPSPTEPCGLIPVNAAPIMAIEEMKKFVAMPNASMPSDHVSLLCDLKWKNYKPFSSN